MKDCERLGLTEAEEVALTGFTWRMVEMLAHLREAWCVADGDNAAAIERGLAEFMRGHSFQRNRRIVSTVLSVGLDRERAEELLVAGTVWATTGEARARTQRGDRCTCNEVRQAIGEHHKGCPMYTEKDDAGS